MTIEGAGGQVVAISYDSVGTLQSFAIKSGITFPLLSDDGSKTIDAYGIRNKQASSRIDGIPHPGTFIVDKTGVVRAKLFLENYRKRHSAEDVVKALKEAK